MNRLAQLSLANRALILLITLAALVFGLLATTSAKRELMPEMDLPMVMVNAQYEGASPEVVENEVTEPLEQALKGVSGVTTYTSTSSNGSSSITAEFDYEDETEDVVRSTQQAVDQVEPMLPDGVEPSVMSFGTDDMPVVMLAAGAGDGDEQELAEPIEEQLIPELESIDGVRAAQLTGVRESTVTITPDEDDLEDDGLTSADVTSALESSGALAPGGEITEDGRTLTVTTGERLESIEQVEDIWVTPGGGGGGAADPGAAAGMPGADSAQADAAQLKDVAEVELKADEETSITRTNGNPSLGIMITKTPEGNTVEISETAQETAEEIAPMLGGDAEITAVFDQAPFIEESITAMAQEGGFGLGFAILVIALFLLSLRSTFVAAVSIPTSLLVAMIGMQVFGYSLNMLTLGALTVSVGRVVDDSIVVLENIKRHLRYGEEKLTAVLTGVREVATAVTASTLTTIAVFLPVAFVGGQTGELFRPFAVTVSLALAASLLVALTIVPVLAYWFSSTRVVPPEDVERIKDEEQRRELRSPLQRAYLPIIRWTTRHRVITLLVTVVLFGGTFAMWPSVKKDFLGQQGQNTYLVTQELEVGTSLEEANEEAQKVEEKLDGMSWMDSYQVSIGSGGDPAAEMMGGGGADTTQYTITADPDADQEMVQEKLRTALEDVDTDTDIRLDDSGGAGSDLEVQVQADGPETLEEATGAVEDTLGDIDGLEDVENSIAATQSQLDVQVDGEDAADEGLTEMQIGQAVTEAFQGAEVGTATIGGVERDMVVRMYEEPASVADLEELEIATPEGDEVELSEVASVEEVNQPPELTREDGARTATVSATPTADDLTAVSTEVNQELESLDLPESATASLGGVSTEQNEAFAQLGLAMLAAIALVFLIMVATFKSLVQPLILLVSIPFAATGSLGLLLVSGVPVGLPSLIGMLMLIGIVVTNAIVLIDLINQNRNNGMELGEAVVEGARHRLRPILMTALATMFALTPMALGFTGGGAFIAAPLAIVVIGGLFTSTLLTLVLVPVLYTMYEARKERRVQRRAAKREAKLAAARSANGGGTAAEDGVESGTAEQEQDESGDEPGKA
ncbi:HAE1 family hydrophobic/amphiphilic exporter-1 [Lipingzhangella halophila]|uniref:HAE1 family hydrophobic/amphiphilic exporter-1 n=1 Tax=Lipingzhangella halophila TaxID=1783352 RepID=A0A7W7RE29_9ACTN|nr:efflux RND transporter permease subunit [Lipingzhangella halophila]MBB4930125.1 HAE1 family hydrophobic/amphiphilic exporter-1 [Lipingzhangella halophila]